MIENFIYIFFESKTIYIQLPYFRVFTLFMSTFPILTSNISSLEIIDFSVWFLFRVCERPKKKIRFNWKWRKHNGKICLKHQNNKSQKKFIKYNGMFIVVKTEYFCDFYVLRFQITLYIWIWKTCELVRVLLFVC